MHLLMTMDRYVRYACLYTCPHTCLYTYAQDSARTQLLLQESVEGLSVVAITYYSTGVLGYLAKAVDKLGLLPVPQEVPMRVSRHMSIHMPVHMPIRMPMCVIIYRKYARVHTHANARICTITYYSDCWATSQKAVDQAWDAAGGTRGGARG